MMKLKVKVKEKDCQLIVKVKMSSDLIINTKQCELLSQKYKCGFLKLNNIKKNKVEFTGPIGISLYERLKSTITEYDFFFIMEQLVDIVQKLEKVGLSRNNLVLDFKYVFINEATKELYFIYLPIVTPHSSISILSFVEQLIYSIKPAEINSNYLSNFSYFLKKFNEFDATKIESYIEQVNSDIVCIIKKLDLKNNYIENIGIDASSTTCDDEKTDIMTEEDELTELSSGDEPTDLLCDDSQMVWDIESKKNIYITDNEETSLLDNEETELFIEDEKTELFDGTQVAFEKYPILIRTLTEEVIKIDKPVFRIGKEENCVDYIVTNNIAISRSHADIISRGERYFVFDLRSKNKSYINNRVLPAEHEVEIFNGDVLKLADEEFLFQL